MTTQDLLNEVLKIKERDSLMKTVDFIARTLDIDASETDLRKISTVLTKERADTNILDVVNAVFYDTSIKFTAREVSHLNTSYIATQRIPTKSDLESLAIWMELLTEYYDESEVFRKHLTNLASLTWCDKTKSILVDLAMLAGEGNNFNETYRMVTQSDSMSY